MLLSKGMQGHSLSLACGWRTHSITSLVRASGSGGTSGQNALAGSEIDGGQELIVA
jgi:hypothetical protein